MTEHSVDYPSPATVWRAILIYLAVCLAGVLLVCSSAFAAPTLEEVATSPETFGICKAADVASTVYLLEHGWAVEGNPIVAWSMNIGGYMPLVFVSAGLYWALKHFKDEAGVPLATGAANVVTCGVAAHNLLLIP